MKLPTKKIYKILEAEGMTHLYHANTLITSCHFLRHGSLLSREKVEKLNLAQTEQLSDNIDKKFGIYNDIFLDSCDIHKRASQINNYGPVIFKINLDILKDESNGDIYITKENPINWNPLDENDLFWFQSIKEVEKGFNKFNFKQILVYRNCKGKLPLDGFLEEIIVDDPERNFASGIDIVSYSMGALRLAYALGPLEEIKFRIRKCNKSCNCKDSYEEFNKKMLTKFFSPLATN